MAWDRLTTELSTYAPALADVVPRELTDAEMENMAGRHRVELARLFFNGPKLRKAARDERLALAAGGAVPAIPPAPGSWMLMDSVLGASWMLMDSVLDVLDVDG